MRSSMSASLLPSSQKKTLFLSFYKTIIYATTTCPGGGYNFMLDLETKDKKQIVYVILRPGLVEFLQAAKKSCFQIVIFTWSWWPRDIMSQILNQIDPTGDIITHQQFKDHYLLDMGKENLVMDLTLTGRTLDTSVIIDHNPDVNVKPWCNAVKVSPFTGDVNDVELWSLLSFFEAQGNFMDLRNLLHVCSCAPPMPGLPLPQTIRKTLFLDLDETLTSHVIGKAPDRYHFATKNFYITKRPGIDRLLQVATDYGYEIVIFTAGSRGYASPIIDRLDPKGLIAHRLYWDSCIKDKEGKPVKDLALTGRSLDKCVIIDDRWWRVRQGDNVIMVRPFTGDMQDSELRRLLCFFKIEREYKDLREAVSCVNFQLGYLNL